MQLLHLAFVAVCVLLISPGVVSSQVCPVAVGSDPLWSVSEDTAAVTCVPVSFPSGNRQQALSGQR